MAEKDEKYTDENAESDFNAGFTDTGKPTPAVVKAEGEDNKDLVEGDEKIEGAAEKIEGAEEKVEGVDEKIEGAVDEAVTVTKSQLERLLASADKADAYDAQISKLFGTTGDLKNLVKQMQEATPKGAKVVIPAEAFKEMEEEYPAIAAHMRKVLEAAAANVKGTSDDKPAGTEGDDAKGALKPEAIQAIVEDSVTRREMTALVEEHPNWRKDVGLTDAKGTVDAKHPFRVWLDKQPVEYKAKVNETNSPLVVSRALDKFRSFAAAEKLKNTPPPNKKAAAQKSRIEDAVTQRGDGAQPKPRKTDDEQFAEGFAKG